MSKCIVVIILNKYIKIIQVIYSKIILFTTNNHVSKRVKNSRVGRKTPNKQTTYYPFIYCAETPNITGTVTGVVME